MQCLFSWIGINKIRPNSQWFAASKPDRIPGPSKCDANQDVYHHLDIEVVLSFFYDSILQSIDEHPRTFHLSQ